MVLDRLGLYRVNIWLSMRAMGKRASSATPIIVALMVLMLDVSVGVSGSEWEINNSDGSKENVELEAIPDIPPLMCESGECPLKDRTPHLPPNGVDWPVQEPGWWFNFWNDKDANGMDDRLQWIISGDRESVSTLSLIHISEPTRPY